jgi:hypothetical protein
MLKVEDHVVEGVSAHGGGPGNIRLAISTTPGRLEIDSTDARREMGYLGTTELAYDGRDYARRRAALGVGDVVSNGDRLAAVHTSENVIAAIAFERMLLDLRDREFQLAFIPRTPPRITYIPGELTIDYVG